MGAELGRVEGGETIIGLYCMREVMFNKKKWKKGEEGREGKGRMKGKEERERKKKCCEETNVK